MSMFTGTAAAATTSAPEKIDLTQDDDEGDDKCSAKLQDCPLSRSNSAAFCGPALGGAMAFPPQPSSRDGARFADFDLTLTDRELDDFLSFMEHQTTGGFADTMPQLPDIAIDFPGLQLQPHSGSPSRSDGSDSGLGTSGAAGAASNGARRPALAPSDGSLTSATMSSPQHEGPGGAGSSGTTPQLLSASSPLDVSSQQQQQHQQPMAVKLEAGSLIFQQQQGLLHFPACSSLHTGVAASASSAAAGSGNSLAGTLAPLGSGALMASCPTSLAQGQTGQYSMQPMQWHSSSAITALAGSAPAPNAAANGQQQQVHSPPLPQPISMPQLLFVQGPGSLPTLLPQPGQQMQQLQPQLLPQQQLQDPHSQQQQQMGLMPPAMISQQMSQQIAAFAGLGSPTAGGSSTPVDHQHPGSAAGGPPGGRGGASRQLQQLQTHQQQQQQQQQAHGSYCDAGKPQISHSTVEKQRRDRLNSLIDELSDMVPPADPKYGSDTNSVRRPKHVILADTINLLKAMQTKLQIEEAEICTLKQQAAAVGAIAAQHQVGQAAVPEAADALMQAAAAGASPDHTYGDACGGAGMMPVELPTAPEAGGSATGVLVEQGIGCLYVKLNCKDRKGLLSDVVSALKGFPIVISTAAITTTKDGNVHDVFEVRIEDPSVTAEDIQFAVQQALFAAERARREGKRLRREDSGVMMSQG